MRRRVLHRMNDESTATTATAGPSGILAESQPFTVGIMNHSRKQANNGLRVFVVEYVPPLMGAGHPLIMILPLKNATK